MTEPSEMHEAMCPALTGGRCTCERNDPAVDKAWARFCGGIGDGPDAPYPGMISAFERYYSQSFTDKDWRNEASVWAAAWKRALLTAAAPTTQPAPQQEVHHLAQALTDRENQPNQYGVEFGMSGTHMHFKIGNQLFKLAYEPDEQEEFDFMKRMLVNAFTTFTHDVKTAPQASPAAQVDALDAARWHWLSEHIQVAWNEGKFTSLVRIVSEQHRQSLNASVDRMMAGDWSDADAARAAQEGASHEQ